MLDNTRRGFAIEMILTISLSSALILMEIATQKNMKFFDIVISAVILFPLSFYIFHILRLSIVYRSHVWLHMLNLPGIAMVIATGESLFNNPSWANIILFLVFAGLYFSLLLIIKFHKKFKVYRVKIPPERYAILRSIMSKKQRITLIFPDRYIKYLETGNIKYLEVKKNA
ncbi:hypothetical protein AciM339_0696 [Aciduliprofundum sp. MAR08-339]|uniref:hypothetical protein n=1 Tax=Aciduliprofundum sp. (strain MAR08-339) TaxID=673860 RepID=UPI0002A49CAB|nr:hypothetical protein AciM339_0696 [Aciduliprofundum sp. MAR08-339]